MRNVTYSLAICGLTLALGSAASCANPDAVRDRVRAELIAAEKAGELPVGEPEIAPRDMFPWLYPTVAKPGITKTRAQVQAEAVAAVQNGTQYVDFAGKSRRELFPGEYPQAAAQSNLAHVAAPSRAN